MEVLCILKLFKSIRMDNGKSGLVLVENGLTDVNTKLAGKTKVKTFVWGKFVCVFDRGCITALPRKSSHLM